MPELGHTQPRQYSLSDKPSPEYYRISVKKEKGLDATASSAATHPGYVSNRLHDHFNQGDTVKVSHPCGDFFLSADQQVAPVVLISAGVGLTPLTSILNTLIPSQRKLHFIHGARTSQARAFKEHVSALSTQSANIQATFFTSQPSEDEKEGIHYQHAGRVDLSKLEAKDLFLDNPQTEYYICGPEKFMTDMESSLQDKGVSPDRIKMELFGTGGVSN